jgi:hypothetical protein
MPDMKDIFASFWSKFDLYMEKCANFIAFRLYMPYLEEFPNWDRKHQKPFSDPVVLKVIAKLWVRYYSNKQIQVKIMVLHYYSGI